MYAPSHGPRAAVAALLVGLISPGCGGSPTEAPREESRLGDRFAEVELPPVTAPEIPADAPLVLFLGDSISAGLHLPADYAFPAVLQRSLAAEGVPFRLANLGSSGDTSAGGAARLDWALRHHKPDIVVIELGGNDGLRGGSLAATRENLVAMTAATKSAGAKPVLVGMKLPPNYGPAYTREFDAIFADVAKAQGAALVPFFFAGFGEDRSEFQPDGIHPAEVAQPKLLDNVWPALERLLPRRRSAAGTGRGEKPAAPGTAAR